MRRVKLAVYLAFVAGAASTFLDIETTLKPWIITAIGGGTLLLCLILAESGMRREKGRDQC